MRMMIGTTEKSDPSPAISSVSFVAREYFGDCDDEIVDSRDGLSLDDGCEMLTEETDEEAVDRYEYEGEDNETCYGEDYEHYRSLEDADVRVAEAAKSALALQKFFSIRKEAEKLTCLRKTKDGEANEPEVVERFSTFYRFDRQCAQNTYRPLVRRKNGRSLGNHGSKGCMGAETSFRELIPVEILLDTADGNTRRIRVG